MLVITMTIAAPTIMEAHPITSIQRGNYSATVKFNGVENAYSHVNVIDRFSNEPIELTTETYTVGYETTGGLVISPKEGYEIQIACSDSSAQNGFDYFLSDQDMDGSLQKTIEFLGSGANDLDFIVTVNEVAEKETVLPLYLTVSTGGMNPTSEDKKFNYNAETGTYELIVNHFAKKVDGKTQYMWFYQIDNDGNIIPWNAAMVTNVQFSMSALIKEYEIEKGMSSGFKIYSFAYDLEEADIKFSVKLNTKEDTQHGITFGSLVMEQLQESKVYPENIYLWGSNIGGRETKVWGTLTPTEEEGIYELNDFLMPIAVFDRTTGYGEEQAFSFFLSTSNESVTKGTRFLGHMDAVEGDASEVTIDLSDGQTFTTTLQTVTIDGSNLMNYTPGVVDLKFDFNTLLFSVNMVKAYNKSTVEIQGTPNQAFEKYLTLEVSGEEYPISLSPQNIWYGGDLSWEITPNNGWRVEVECTTPGATVSIVENNGKYILTSSQNDLEFIITVLEPKKVEFTFTFNEEPADVSVINQSLWCIDIVGIASDEDDGLNADGNVKDEFILDIDSNPFFLTLNSDKSDMRGTMVMFVPKEDYDLDIKCTNWEGTGETPFVIGRPAEASESGDLDGGSMSAGWTVSLSPDAADLEFIVNIFIKESGSLKVDEIVSSNNLTVYNMQGSSVLHNAKPEDLKILAPGLYIINGKKIAIN